MLLLKTFFYQQVISQLETYSKKHLTSFTLLSINNSYIVYLKKEKTYLQNSFKNWGFDSWSAYVFDK